MCQCLTTFNADPQPSSVGLLCIALDVLPYESVLRLIQDGQKLSSDWQGQDGEKGKKTPGRSGVIMCETDQAGQTDQAGSDVSTFLAGCPRFLLQLHALQVEGVAVVPEGHPGPVAQRARAVTRVGPAVHRGPVWRGDLPHFSESPKNKPLLLWHTHRPFCRWPRPV